MKKILSLIAVYLVPMLLFGQTNLIPNAGLENDTASAINIPYSVNTNIAKGVDPNTWILSYTGASTGNVNITTSEKYKGTQSMELQLKTIDARYRFYMTNDLKNITPGKYKFSFFAKANVADIPFRIDIMGCSGANYNIEKQLIGSTLDANGNVVAGREGIVQKTKTGWTQYSYIFDASKLTQEDMSLLRLVIRPNCTASGSSGIQNKPVTYWFDDFSLALMGETDFTFEDGVPSQWAANQGSLDVSQEHYKEGKQSLRWQSTANASMAVSFDRFAASTSTSFYFYNPQITSDTLFIDFREGEIVKKTARVLLNFSGWRNFSRTYAEYASPEAADIDNIVFRRVTKSTSPQTLYFDDVKLDTAPDGQRMYGHHMVMDKQYFTTGTSLLNLYSNTIDIETVTPSAEDLAGIAKLQAIFKQKPTAGTEAKLKEARDFVNSLNIQYNPDGTVKGNALNTMQPINKTYMINASTYVEVLAASTVEADKTLFNSLVDYLLDQGIAESVNFVMVPSDYTTIRTVPKGFLSALELYNDKQKDGVLKLVRWIVEYGKLYYPENEYLSTLNADIITNYLGYFNAYAVYQSQPDIIMRELKGVTRFLERNTSYVPGANGILKLDGTAFHHNSHYNNYMYSFRTWVQYVYYLKDTPFRIHQEPYNRMKKAIVSMYTMATRDTDAIRYTANSLSGRNPFAKGGTQVPIYKSEFKKLVEIGGDIVNQEIDKELAATYNYFFMTDEYPNVGKQDYSGFHQFNYSPIGVYRQNNWVATMRNPTAKLWGSEIYSETNRLGRYQSHGTLEVMYNGTLEASGYPTDAQCGGWDWNVIPGATTVHYTSWREMMPKQNTTQRFDQYTKTKNFSGSLAWKNYGMFAADFDQTDTWGGQQFEPTNLVFKKSVFAFDDMLFCMGSNIGASGNYSNDMITATNLFQGIKSSLSGKFIINGTEVTEGYDEIEPLDNNLWLITPQSTGYFIPKGNDELAIKYGQQTTPIQTGADVDNPTTTSVAAKAYLQHGVKTNNKRYSYIVMPDANDSKMIELAKNVDELFEVKYQDSIVHALVYKPQNITAYSIFQPVDTLSAGILKGSATQLLLMVSEDKTLGNAKFAVSNPNLNPTPNSQFGWISTPTQASITLRGKWLSAGNYPNISIVSGDEETQVSFTLSDGEPIYFDLRTEKKVSTFEEFERALKDETITDIRVVKGFRFERNITNIPNRDVVVTGSKDIVIDSHIWSIYGKQNAGASNTFSILNADIVADPTVGRFFTGSTSLGGWNVYSSGVNYSGARFVHLSEGTLTFDGNNNINTRCENAWVHNLVFKNGSVYKGTAASGGQFSAFYFNGALVNGKVTGTVTLENNADVNITISPNNDQFYYYPAFYDKIYKVDVNAHANLNVDAAGVAFQFIPRADYTAPPSLNIADGAIVELNGRGGGNYATIKLQQYNTEVNVNKGGTLNITGNAKYGVVESIYRNSAINMNDGKELTIENKSANAPLFKSTATQLNLKGVSEIETWVNKNETPTQTFSGFGTLNTVIDGKSNGNIYADNLPATQGFQLANYGKIRILGGSKKFKSRFASDENLLGEIVLKSSSQGGILTVSCNKTIELWEVYSITQLVTKAKVNNATVSIALPVGVYIIRAVVEGQTIQTKVMVQ